MDLISIIVIIAIILKVMKQGKKETNKVKSNTNSQNLWNQLKGQVQSGQAQSRQYTSEQNEEWKRLARENIEKAKRRASEKLREVERSALGLDGETKSAGTYQMPKQNTRTTPAYEQLTLQQMAQQQRKSSSRNETFQQASQHRQQENKSAMKQVHAGRLEAKNTSILQRAKANAEEDRVDITLKTMEAEHNHSERVSPAEHYHPEDMISDNMLGTIEDLMVKGYDGNLCFERDFVGEAMDMISRFTVPSDIPDFSEDDVA